MKIKEIIEEYHDLVSVRADSSLTEAMTKMMMNDFSQLAVTDVRNKVIGFISWRTIGYAHHYKEQDHKVLDYMDKNFLNIKDTERVFEYFNRVLEKEFAFISDSDGNVYTILTLYDLAFLFKEEYEPFYQLKMIERTLRTYIKAAIDEERFLTFCNKHISKKVQTPNDLMFGQYLKILGNIDFWDEFQMPLHKETFIEKLDSIRQIRNMVMHFKTVKLSKQELKHLQDINKFFRVQDVMRRR